MLLTNQVAIPGYNTLAYGMASGGKIQTHSKRIIEHCCRELLVQNYDPDACEHPDAGDQIREVLIRRNYVAQKDIESCCCLDVSGMAGEAAIADLRAPRDVFVKTCERMKLRFSALR
jgi:hypothetical protein